jgi:hypothetical protein
LSRLPNLLINLVLSVKPGKSRQEELLWHLQGLETVGTIVLLVVRDRLKVASVMFSYFSHEGRVMAVLVHTLKEAL